MTTRSRKLLGGVVLLVFIIVYAFVAMVLGDMTLRDASPLAKLAYFAVAGLIWVLPAGLIIRFMQRADT